MTQSFYDVPAPAKINLFLHVIGKRFDGYHLMHTVFQFINLNDILSFEIRRSGLISRSTSQKIIKFRNDLTIRAAQLLQKITGTKLGVHIKIKKNIPMGSGLGGGSSDAATTLIVLNKLWKTNLNRLDLMKIGSMLGADIPAFVFGKTAFAYGIGDRMRAVYFRPNSYLLIVPRFPVLTTNVYQSNFLQCHTMKFQLEKKFITMRNSSVLRNDLQGVVYNMYPEIKNLAKKISEILILNLEKIRMSGSGSCLYITYSNKDEATFAQMKIESKMKDIGNSIFLRESAFNSLVTTGLTKHPLYHWIKS